MQKSQILADRFELHEFLSEGGMGAVYRGHDTQTGQPVAIKLMKASVLANDPTMLERFNRESEALRALNHPNIVKSLALVQQDNQHYLVMEFVSGGSLEDLLQKQPQLALDQVLKIALELSDALARAHHLKIIHRDIKPANILLAEDGTPRLADFGVARTDNSKITKMGYTMGTFAYLPPEALGDQGVDTCGDLWSFGVMLFQMLTGRLPFEGENYMGLLTAILSQPTPDLEQLCPGAPLALVDLIYRMLEKDRTLRISSARQVGAELEAIINNANIPMSSHVTRTEYSSVFRERPSNTSQLIPNNLRLQTTEFLGRQEEIAELKQQIANPSIRLVTVLGPGGMGKTRLAQETANRLLDQFPNGVYLVSLAPLRAENLLPAIADAVNYQFQPQETSDLKQQLLAYFREKTVLLVLDNFEHLLECSSTLLEILDVAPKLKLLITSRARLNLSSEIVFNLGGMDYPKRDTTQDLLSFGAIKLFIQSVQRTRPGYVHDGADIKQIVAICRLVDGMPLALQLAASWIEMLSLAEIKAEISRNWDLLETDMRDVPERQRSIKGLFDYSWNLLSEEERSVFIKLSVFRGGCGREGAQQITGASLRTLTGLVNKSLLRRSVNSGRYDIHEMLRQYGAEKLESSGQADVMRETHSQFYLGALTLREAGFKGNRQLETLDSIDQEIENGRAAWQWAVKQKNFEALDRVLESIYLFCQMRSRFDDCEELLSLALEQLAPQSGESAHPLLARCQTRYELLLKPHADTKLHLNQSLEIAKQHNNKAEIAFTQMALGIINFKTGIFAEAVVAYQESLKLYQEVGDKYYIANCAGRLGYLFALIGKSDDAFLLTKKSLDLSRQIGDTVGMATATHYLGASLFFAGDFNSALKYCEDASTIRREIGDRAGRSWSDAVRATMLWFMGQFETARKIAQDAYDTAIDVHFMDTKGLTSCTLSVLASMDGDYAKGKKLGEEAREITKSTIVIGAADWGIAFANYNLGDFPGAQQYILKGLQFATSIRGITPTLWAIPIFVMLYIQQGKLERAAEILSLEAHFPLQLNGWADKWQPFADVKGRLLIEMGIEKFDAAWERGKKLNLEETVAAFKTFS
jgi:predicted ATPase/predicted Ser/Thr protein kinase